jgi:hypothetical protein
MEGPSLIWMGRSLDWLTSTLKILLYLLVSWMNAWLTYLSLLQCDDDGESIIDLDGKVVGLVNKHLKKSFVPSCILDKCVDMWCEFRYDFSPIAVKAYAFFFFVLFLLLVI